MDGQDGVAEFASQLRYVRFLQPVKQLPIWLWDLVALRHLEIGNEDRGNHLDIFIQDQAVGIKHIQHIGRLTNLTCLSLEDCSRLRSLPASLSLLTGLHTMCLSGCVGLKELPPALGSLACLTRLELMHLPIEKLPDSLSALEALEVLDLSGCARLPALPAWVSRLVRLSVLDLGFCDALISIPQSVATLPGLWVWSVGGCANLRDAPSSLAALSVLASLNLDWCKNLRFRLEETLWLAPLVWLESLSLASLQLEGLHPCVGNLTNLRSLNLEGNETLQEVPACLRSCTALSSLKLRGCSRMQVLPEWLGEMPELCILDVAFCQLSSPPAEVGFPPHPPTPPSTLWPSVRSTRQANSLPPSR